MDIREFFARFSNANYFSRVDNQHPLDIHIGLDDKGRKAIELRSSFIPRKVTGTSAIEVNQYKKPEYNTLRFSLLDEDVSGLFYMFCEDLINETRTLKDNTSGYTAILTRFFQWKKMFVASKNSFLSEPEIMGLIGEILYLQGPLAQKLGLSDALRSWSGQELTHKDFSYGSTWAEVKVVSSGAQFVKISSLEQLDSEFPGELAVYSLEKMSKAYNGITLNKLVISTRNMFTPGDEQDSFMSKTALQGYEYNNYYDDFMYEISGLRRYKVDSLFPKLTANDVPSAIRKASYELSLVDITPFEIDQ